VDVGIIAPVLGIVLAAVVVLVLWWFMRMRGSKSATRSRTSALSESEAEFLDSSHIISGTPADARRNAADKAPPSLDRLP
jgi:hypothetical protein